MDLVERLADLSREFASMLQYQEFMPDATTYLMEFDNSALGSASRLAENFYGEELRDDVALAKWVFNDYKLFLKRVAEQERARAEGRPAHMVELMSLDKADIAACKNVVDAALNVYVRRD